MSEVPDEKLNELIEEYADKVYGYNTCGTGNADCIKQAKQAIIDYHDKKVRECRLAVADAIKPIVDIATKALDIIARPPFEVPRSVIEDTAEKALVAINATVTKGKEIE